MLLSQTDVIWSKPRWIGEAKKSDSRLFVQGGVIHESDDALLDKKSTVTFSSLGLQVVEEELSDFGGA